MKRTFIKGFFIAKITKSFFIHLFTLFKKKNHLIHRKYILRNISTISTLDHSNILKLSGLIKREEKIIGTFIHCSNYSNLQDFLQENEFTPGKNSIRFINSSV